MKIFLVSILLLLNCSLFGQGLPFTPQYFASLNQTNAVAGGGGIPSGLVAWWKLNDGSGLTSIDSASTNTGTFGGTGNSWNGTTNLSFNGSGYVTIANESNFDFERTSPFTFSAWVKYTAGTGSVYIFTKSASTGNQQGYEVRMDLDNSRARVFITSTTAESMSVSGGSGSFGSGAFHLLTVTYDGTSTGSGLKLYYDGSLQATSGSGPITNSILNNASAILVGGNSGSSPRMVGTLDDVRVYNYALNSTEVSALYSGGAQ